MRLATGAMSYYTAMQACCEDRPCNNDNCGCLAAVAFACFSEYSSGRLDRSLLPTLADPDGTIVTQLFH